MSHGFALGQVVSGSHMNTRAPACRQKILEKYFAEDHARKVGTVLVAVCFNMVVVGCCGCMWSWHICCDAQTPPLPISAFAAIRDATH
jgi:hypothetical protein